MKAKKALGMALALASALFFVACSNMGSGSVDNGAAYVYNTDRTLNITVDGVDLSDGSGTAVYDPLVQMTVLPEETYSLDPLNTTLTLVLKAISNGKAEKYYVLSGGLVDTPATGQTQFSLTLPAASYDFWLYAYKTADITAQSVPVTDPNTAGKNIVDASEINGGTKISTVYWAHGAQDLTNGTSSTISFTLSPVDLKGNGTINVGGAFVDPNGIVAGIKIGIYNIFTNEIVKGGNPAQDLLKSYAYTKKRSTIAAPNYFGGTEAPVGADIANVDPGDHSKHIVPEGQAASFTAPAGSYRIGVTFYSDTGYTKEVGYWSDIVIVEPTNKSNCLDIVFQGINTRPAAPTALTASLVKDSYKKNGQVNGKYDVILEWEDNASNEKGYLVRVTPYTINFGSGTETPGAPVILGFAASASDVEGNVVKALLDPTLGYFTQTTTASTNLLLSQCESVTLTLDTGYLYDFEVVAYNAIGYSEYVPDYGGTPDTANALKDNFSATSSDPNYYDKFLQPVKGIWTPRRITGTDESGASGKDYSSDDITKFVSDKMLYKQAAPEAAAPAAYTDVDTSAVTEPVAGTAYYVSTDGKNTYKRTYLTKWETPVPPATIDYATLTPGTGTPYISYHVNLYTIEYNLKGGKLYQESKVKDGNHYAFFRYGNDNPSLNTFGPVVTDTMNGADFLTNPITATGSGAPTPTSKGTTATEPFILKWNTSNTAYSNWFSWYRESQTMDGTTVYYNNPKVFADILEFNAGAYGNQTIYASYAGNESPLTIIVDINSASAGTNNILNTFITAEAVASDSVTSGTTLELDTNNPANTPTSVNTTTLPYIYLKLDTSTVAYTGVRYYINRVQQSNVTASGCYVDITDPALGDSIQVIILGWFQGQCYSKSFTVNLEQ